jgi:acyl-CoA synthetase (AMP-forming)/AMP-acid ligase II
MTTQTTDTVSGTAQTPQRALLADRVLVALDHAGTDVVMVAGRRRVTGAGLAAQIRAETTALRRAGVGLGTAVGFAGLPGPDTLAALMALRAVGACAVLLEPSSSPEVNRARMRAAGVQLMWASASVAAAAGPARRLAARRGIHLPRLGDLAPHVAVFAAPRVLRRGIPGVGRPLSAGLLGSVSDEDPLAGAVRPGDAVVIGTSGTTEAPRAVVHTEATLSATVEALGVLVDARPGQRVLAGTFFALLPALLAGAVAHLPRRSPRGLAAQLASLRPDVVYLTPPQVRDALDAGAAFTGRVYSGSAPVTHTLLQRVVASGAEDAFGVYALTEVAPVAAVSAGEKSAFVSAGRRGDLLGRPMPGVTVTTDPDGQLEVTAPSMCDRYLHGRAGATRVVTGDLGRLEDGCVVMHGRAKDMVLRRAENIYPGLYEPGLHVPGVRLAVLVGVPAADGDELLVALVEPEPGTQPAVVRERLRPVLEAMGSASPDAVLFAAVPLAGRSRKPDRPAASVLCARLLAAGPQEEAR